jgi:adenylate cyclase
VRCSVEVQKALAARNANLAEDQQMRFRIGINLGDVITKSDGTVYGDGVNVAARLESLAEPGGIMISETVRMQVRSQVDIGIADAGDHEVKNIVEPMRAYRVELDGAAEQQRKPRKFSPARIGIVWAILLIVVVVGSRFSPDVGSEDPILTLPDGPSIAVLPFDNMSGDPDQDYFADGITEDIITGLSRFTELFVIARNSTYQYKGKSVDVRDVGTHLGVQYVLEGSVRVAGDNIRVTAQLLDATTGSHLWADSYDRDMTTANLFELQDDIREHIVAKIAGGYGAITRDIVATTEWDRIENLNAYNCVLKAKDYYRVFSESKHFDARECLAVAIENGESHPEVVAWLGLMYLDEWRFGYNKQNNDDKPLDKAFTFARRAVDLDQSNQDAQHALFKILFFRKELDLFAIHRDQALRINPSNVFTLSDAAFFTGFSGDWDRGVSLLRKAVKLDPDHPGWYHFLFFYDKYRKGEYGAALREAQQINTPGLFFSFAVLAAAYGQLGREAEAQDAVHKLLELHPTFARNMRKDYAKYNMSDDLIDHLAEGLRKAGLHIPDEPIPADK